MALSVKNMLGGTGGSAYPFAWGKYEYGQKRVEINVKATRTTSGQTLIFTLESSDVDISTLSIDDLVGMVIQYKTSTYPYYTIDSSTSLTNAFSSSSITSCTYRWNANEKKLTIDSAVGGSYDGSDYIVSGLTIPKSAPINFLEYVTDKNPLKYPNGEVADDGFFYRYANEGLYTWEKYNIVPKFGVNYKDMGSFPTGITQSNGRSRCIVHNGYPVVLGGYNINTMYYLDGETWKQGTNIPAIFYNGAAVSHNGKIHVFGGNYSTGMHYVIDDVNGTWESKASVPNGTYREQAVSYNGKIHIIGGYQSITRTRHLVYDDVTDTYEALPALSTNAYDGQAVVYDGKIHLFNGTTHRVFDGTTWTNLDTTPFTAGQDTSVVVFENKIYAFRVTNYYVYDGEKWETFSNALTISTAYGVVAPYGDSMYVITPSAATSKWFREVGWYNTYDYIDTVISDNENAYPKEDVQEGFYYIFLSKSVTGSVRYTSTQNGNYNRTWFRNNAKTVYHI